MSRLLRFPQIIVLMVLFSFLSLAAVVFTPAYPELTKEFGLTGAGAQWMMTLFLLGTAFGRLPYGPLANRWGRKKTLFIGLFISVIGTLFTLFTDSYVILCLGRFIQAAGCSVTLKIGYTMIGDLHEGPEATRVLSYAMLAYSILPGIGTSISGFLTPQFGWKGGFWFFLIFTFFLILGCFSLPETIKKIDPDALQIRKIAIGYANQFKSFRLVLWSCLMGLSTAVIFVFSLEAPFVGIELMGLLPAQYGVLYLVPAFGIAGGALLTAWLSDKMSPLHAMLLGILNILAGALLMGGLFLAGWVNGWTLFLPQSLVQLGDAILYTNASSEALSDAEDKSNASAIMLFINSIVSVVGTFLVGVYSTKSLMTIPLVFLLMTTIMLFIWGALRYKKT